MAICSARRHKLGSQVETFLLSLLIALGDGLKILRIRRIFSEFIIKMQMNDNRFFNISLVWPSYGKSLSKSWCWSFMACLCFSLATTRWHCTRSCTAVCFACVTVFWGFVHNVRATSENCGVNSFGETISPRARRISSRRRHAPWACFLLGTCNHQSSPGPVFLAAPHPDGMFSAAFAGGPEKRYKRRA